MHGITVQGTVPAGTTKVTASDCSSVGNNQPVATGGNILAPRRRLRRQAGEEDPGLVGLAEPAEEGGHRADVRRGQLDDQPGLRAAAGRRARRPPTRRSSSRAARSRRTPRSSSTARATRGTAAASFIVLKPAEVPKGIKDTDAYSHFSFVRTLQDMFLLSDPTKDGSYMNRSKYTEKFIAQNILNLPEFAGSADTHFDSVRPMNHGFGASPATRRRRPTTTLSCRRSVPTARRPTSGRSSNVTVTHPKPAVAVNAASAGFFHGSDRDTQLVVRSDRPGRRRLRALR